MRKAFVRIHILYLQLNRDLRRHGKTSFTTGKDNLKLSNTPVLTNAGLTLNTEHALRKLNPSFLPEPSRLTLGRIPAGKLQQLLLIFLLDQPSGN